MNSVLNEIGGWSSQLEGQLKDVQNTIKMAEETYIEDANSVIDIVEEYARIAWIMIPLLIFASILFVGGVLASFNLRLKAFFCIQGWVILPLFVMSLALSVFLSCVCAFVLVLNAGKLTYHFLSVLTDIHINIYSFVSFY